MHMNTIVECKIAEEIFEKHVYCIHGHLFILVTQLHSRLFKYKGHENLLN